MPSYSTLVRRAKAARTKALRRKLLDQANALRSAARKAKRRAGKPKEAMLATHDPAKGWSVRQGIVHEKEIADTKASQLAWMDEIDRRYDQLSKTIRKGDVEDAKIMIRSIGFTGIAEARAALHEQHMKALEANNRTWTEKIVAGLIAGCSVMQQAGELPNIICLSRVTLSCILRALAEAGWSENGFRAPNATKA